MKEIVLTNMESAKEYFCNECGQLRLSLSGNPKVCGNCRSDNLTVGELNTLDKDYLKADWASRQLS